MASTESFTTNATLRVIRSMVPEFQKDAIDVTLRNRVTFALLRKWKRIMLGVDVSTVRVWNARNRLPQSEEWTDSPHYDFPAGPEQQQYSLDVGGYRVPESLSKQEELRNKGKNQIISLVTEKAQTVQQSQANRLNNAFYHGDGPTGGSVGMTGLDVGLTATAVPSTDIVAKPNDSYAGKSTNVNVTGSWGSDLTTSPNASIATDWPENPLNGTPDYDWNSPLILVTNSTKWSEGPEWINNCGEVMRYWCMVQSQRGGSVADPSVPKVFIHGERRLREFKTWAEARSYRLEPVPERIRIGMPEEVLYDGAIMTTDSDVANDQTYVVQPDMLEFYSAFDDIWELNMTNFDPEHRKLWDCLSFGNWRRGSQKFFGELTDF